MAVANQLEIWPLLRELQSPSDAAGFPLAGVVLPTVLVGSAPSLLRKTASHFSGYQANVVAEFGAFEVYCPLEVTGGLRIVPILGATSTAYIISLDRIAPLCAGGNELNNMRNGHAPSVCTVFRDTLVASLVDVDGPHHTAFTNLSNRELEFFLQPGRYAIFQDPTANNIFGLALNITDLL